MPLLRVLEELVPPALLDDPPLAQVRARVRVRVRVTDRDMVGDRDRDRDRVRGYPCTREG